MILELLRLMMADVVLLQVDPDPVDLIPRAHAPAWVRVGTRNLSLVPMFLRGHVGGLGISIPRAHALAWARLVDSEFIPRAHAPAWARLWTRNLYPSRAHAPAWARV